MAAKRRWINQTVLIVALVALVGSAAAPLLIGALNAPATPPTPGPNTAAPATPAGPKPLTAPEREALTSQAKGFAMVLEKEPENPTALQGLIEAKLKLGDFVGVEQPLSTLVRVNPQQPGYRVLLAQVQQKLGKLDLASQSYRQVLEKDPSQPEALRGLTALLLAQNKPDAAVSQLYYLLFEQKDKVPAARRQELELLLAQTYLTTGKVDDALKLYRQMAQTTPQDFRPQLAIALVERQRGQAAAATSAFGKALALAPAQYRDQIRQLQAAPTTR